MAELCLLQICHKYLIKLLFILIIKRMLKVKRDQAPLPRDYTFEFSQMCASACRYQISGVAFIE